MLLDIKITGSGSAEQLVAALQQVVDDLKVGNHINSINTKGEAEWEDPILMTTISEADQVWAEIRTNFVDEDGNTHIDGWLTDDDDEDGRTIAIVSKTGEVTYTDSRAETDANAQEYINEVIDQLNQ